MPSQALRFFIAASLAVFPAGGTTAQGWPSRPVTYIVPFSAGSGPDVLARNISNELTAKFNQPLIVENRPGANGNIGAAVVSKAAPDGYTFLSVTPGIAVQNKYVYKSMPFDFDRTSFQSSSWPKRRCWSWSILDYHRARFPSSWPMPGPIPASSPSVRLEWARRAISRWNC